MSLKRGVRGQGSGVRVFAVAAQLSAPGCAGGLHRNAYGDQLTVIVIRPPAEPGAVGPVHGFGGGGACR